MSNAPVAAASEGITVVVTACDYARYLGECLDSLLAQTRPPQQWVLVDDGSTDETPQVLDDYQPLLAAVAPVVRLRHPARQGVAPSLNEAFGSATQPLVVNVDADDVVAPAFLESLANALGQHPERHFAYPRMRLFGIEAGVYLTHPFDGDRLLFEGNYIPNVALMRLASFRATPGYRVLPTHVDWDLWLSFLERGMHGVLVDEVLYHWRRHGSGVTLRSPSTRLRARLAVLWWHRALVARRWRAAPRWTWRALVRRVGARRSGRLTPSGWVDPPDDTSVAGPGAPGRRV